MDGSHPFAHPLSCKFEPCTIMPRQQKLASLLVHTCTLVENCNWIQWQSSGNVATFVQRRQKAIDTSKVPRPCSWRTNYIFRIPSWLEGRLCLFISELPADIVRIRMIIYYELNFFCKCYLLIRQAVNNPCLQITRKTSFPLSMSATMAWQPEQFVWCARHHP